MQSFNFVLPIGFVLIIAVLALTTFLFSSDARDRRKRRRNYGPVISNARRPTVQLSVRLPRS
jgi:hypothetical protein